MEEKEDPPQKVIFAVDDEPELLRSLERLLLTRYKVLTSTRSIEVMELLKSERVDCMLLDIRMPGMTGIELLKEIKFTYPHIPVLIMTGHGDENDAIIALRYGASGYFKKPIDMHVLFDEIERVTSSTEATVEIKKPAKIMIMDDDQEFLTSLKRTLSTYPYKTEFVTDTDEAFKLLKDHEFDIVIVDAVMPKMSGLQFLAEVKKTHSDFISIIITGAGSQTLAIEAIKNGVFDYIQKPVQVRDIVSSIERSVHKLEINREITQKNVELSNKEQVLKKLNDEIMTQKNFLENIVKSISNMLIITDEKGIIQTLNDAILKTLNYEAHELIGKPLTVIYPVGDLEKFLGKVVLDLGFTSLESEYLKKGAEKIFVLFSGSAIKGGDDKLDGFVFAAQDISAHKEAEQELHRLSYFDVLTRLPNRLHFEMAAKQAIALAERNSTILAFLYIDLDGFKAVNDRLGHPVGDELLQEVAKRLQTTFRAHDFIGRVGGDEFVAVLTKITDKADAGIVAQRLIASINKPYYINGNEISIGVSMGIAMFPDTGANFDQLFKNSDVALYKAKYAGRNQYQYFTKQLDLEHGRQLDIENALHFAVGRNEFSMVYQPIFSIATKKMIAVEALIRWDSPSFGSIAPDFFIPIAEYNGLIIPIGEWILDTTLKQFAEWKEKYKVDFRLALNISSCQLDRGEYIVNLLKQMTKKYKVSPHWIELELTETAIMHNPKQSEKILRDLADMGFLISMDDFGQGHSSLSLLSRLPVAIIKIDKQFVGEMNEPKNRSIVKTIISLSKSLSLSVIAEGVETQEQLDILQKEQCDYLQGYLYSKPLQPDALIELLQNRAKAE